LFNIKNLISNSVSNKTINEGDNFSYYVSASDPNNDSLSYSINGPSGMSINSSGRIYWSTDYYDSGSYSIKVTVSDGEYSISRWFTLTVKNSYSIVLPSDSSELFRDNKLQRRVGSYSAGTPISNIDLVNADASNVINMEKMFFRSTNFNQDISNWNVSNVENMNYMFSDAASFNRDLSSWDFSGIREEYYNFSYYPLVEQMVLNNNMSQTNYNRLVEAIYDTNSENLTMNQITVSLTTPLGVWNYTGSY
jgi:surface protein